MIEVPIDNPERVKEIFMDGGPRTVATLDKRPSACKPGTTETPTRAVEQQIVIQQDLISDLHGVISTLNARLEKVIISCPTNDAEDKKEQEELSSVAHHIRLNNDSLANAICRIRRLTDDIEI